MPRPRGLPPDGGPRRRLRAALTGALPIVLVLVACAPGSAAPASIHPAALTVPAPTTNTSALDLGMALNVSVAPSNVTGGSGDIANYTIAWLGLPTNCTSANVWNFTCTPSATGTFSISANVTDPTGHTSGVSTAVAIVVTDPPSVTGLAASAATVTVGGSLSFTATATGGAAPLTYAWTGLPAGCTETGANVACTPTVAGTYSVSVTVTDAVGWAAAANAVNVTVQPTATTTSSSGPTTLDWGVIAGILIVGFLLAGLLFARASREEKRSYAAKPKGPMPPPPST